MATINPAQDYDMIQTLTFIAASGTCKIRLYRNSTSAYAGTVKVREGTSGTWSDLSVSGEATTFNVTNTTMQVAHDWNKIGNSYMTCSFNGQTTNLTGIAISQKAVLSGIMGSYFMFNYAKSCSKLTSLDAPDTSGVTGVATFFMIYYADSCSSLTSLGVPDTSNITSVGDYFMYQYAVNCTGLTSLAAPDTSSIKTVGASFMHSYAQGGSKLTSLGVPDTSSITTVGADFMRSYAYYCDKLTSLGIPDTSSMTTVSGSLMSVYAGYCNALTTLILPSVGWFATHDVNWSVPAGRLTYLKGQVLDSSDVAGWRALTTSTAPNTLYLNYIRSDEDVLSLAQEETGTASSSIGFRHTLEFDNAFVTTLSNSIGCQSTLKYSKLEVTSITLNNLQPYIVVYRYRRTA